MACNTNLIADIINSCTNRPTKGIYPTVWIVPFEGREYTKTDNLITLLTSPQGIFTKFESNKFGLNIASELVSNEVKQNGYLHKFTGIVSQIGNKNLDTMDGIIVVVKKGTAYMVYGLQNGLWKTSQTRMANDNSGMITVEFASRPDMEEDYSEYFFDTATVNGLYNLLTPLNFVENFEQITGLTISTSENINSSTATVLESNGNVFVNPVNATTTATGEVVIFSPKDALDIAYSDFIGILNTNASTIDVNNCVVLTGINALNLETLNATECAFSAEAIANILANAVASGITNGTLQLQDGSNDVIGAWSVQAVADKATLVSRSWTVLNNA